MTPKHLERVPKSKGQEKKECVCVVGNAREACPSFSAIFLIPEKTWHGPTRWRGAGTTKNQVSLALRARALRFFTVGISDPYPDLPRTP